MISGIEKNELVQENIDLRNSANLYKVWEFDLTAKTTLNCFKKGGFRNLSDDLDSEDEDNMILADLKDKWNAVEFRMEE